MLAKNAITGALKWVPLSSVSAINVSSAANLLGVSQLATAEMLERLGDAPKNAELAEALAASDWHQLWNRRRTAARSAALVGCLLVPVVFAVLTPDAARLSLARWLLGSSERWPQRTYLTVIGLDARGRLIDNAAERYAYTSAEVVWSADRAVEIVLAPRARGGNWLPTGARPRLKVALRLYDAPFSFTAA